MRMGREKALLEIDGVPLWRRQRELLARAGATEIFLSVRPEQEWARRADGFDAVLHDALPNVGPLCGITAAIERASHEHVAVVAIDLPQMPSEWFRGLVTECAPRVGAVGQNGDMFEPLAAIFPVEFKWLAWEAIAAGRYALQGLLANGVARGLLRVRPVGVQEQRWFENWNEPTRVPSP